MATPAKKRYRLTGLALSEVSLVDRGANQLSKVVLYKRDSKETTMTDQTDAQKLQAMTAERDALVKKVDGLAAEATAQKTMIADLNTRLQKAEADKAEIEKRLPPDVKPVELPAEVKAAIEKANKDANDALQALEKLRDENATQIFVAKAEVLKALPGVVAKDFGGVLKRVAANKATAEDVVALEKVLSDANATIEAGVLKSAGGDRQHDAGVTAMAKLEAAAADIRKADPKLTAQQAIAKAMTDNPDLYTAYLKEIDQAA